MPEGVDNVIVVGASLAGVRAAETLRKDGHVGPLVVIGAEHHTPYDRPPLSKEVLTSTVEPDLSLRAVAAGLDVDLRLGLSATALRAEARELDLSDGTTLRFDGLVVATGCRARTLPGTEDIQRVLTLRTLDDARRLRRLLAEGARRVLVVGGRRVVSEPPMPGDAGRTTGPAVGEDLGARGRIGGRRPPSIERG